MNKIKFVLLTIATILTLGFTNIVNADMKVTDVSSWQGDYTVGSYSEDAVIVKATQGTSYVNPYMTHVVNQALAQGKPWGLYHYASGGDATAEANHFYNYAKQYLNNKNKPILFLDWESGENPAWGNGQWAKVFTDRIKELTGVQPGLYTGADGIAQTQNYLSKTTALWFAGYPTMTDVGWSPIAFNTLYNTGSWETLTGWQFSSTPLDKSIFYTDAKGWAKIAGDTSGASQKPVEPSKPVTPQVTPETFKTHTVRSGESLSVIAQMYGTTWQKLAQLNNLANPSLIYPGNVLKVTGAAQTNKHVVQSGESLSSIAAQHSTTWQHLAQSNGLTNPNLIYPGQTINL